MLESQRKYEELIVLFQTKLVEARQLNRDAHLDLLKEVQSSLNREFNELGISTEDF